MARDTETLRNLTAKCDHLEARLNDARSADAERRRCLSERDAIQLTEEFVSGLKKIERARDLAEERLRAAATRVEHRLEPGAVVHLGEESIAGDGSVLMTQRTELRVRGVGLFSIIPGGEDLDVLRRKVEEEDRQLVQGFPSWVLTASLVPRCFFAAGWILTARHLNMLQPLGALRLKVCRSWKTN